MQDFNHNFLGEISEGWLFLGFGICSSLIALYFLLRKKKLFWKGIAYVFMTIGLFQSTVGLTILVKSPANQARLEKQIRLKNTDYLDLEIKKTKTLLENLNFYKWAGISFFIVGFLVFFNFDNSSSWKGIGMGLMIESIVMQLLNYLTTARIENFLVILKTSLD